MSDLLSIGEFAELSGLTVKVLRLYDQRGILRPTTVDFSSGYRYYSRSQAVLAKRIRALRLLQVPLAEMQVLLSTDDRGTVAGILEQHRHRIRERISSWRR